MITEIELSEIVSQLLLKSCKPYEEIKNSYLRSIGDFIEQRDSSCRVSLNDCSYYTFQSRSPQRIIIGDESIAIRGLNTPMMKALIKQYQPNNRVAQKIDEAVANISEK